MAAMSKAWYREQAKHLITDAGFVIEIDEHAEISTGNRPYGWVQAWIRIDDPQQPPEESACQHTSEPSAPASAAAT